MMGLLRAAWTRKRWHGPANSGGEGGEITSRGGRANGSREQRTARKAPAVGLKRGSSSQGMEEDGPRWL